MDDCVSVVEMVRLSVPDCPPAPAIVPWKSVVLADGPAGLSPLDEADLPQPASTRPMANAAVPASHPRKNRQARQGLF